MGVGPSVPMNAGSSVPASTGPSVSVNTGPSVLASTGSYAQFSVGLSVPVSSTSPSVPVSAGSPERSGMHTYEASTSPVVGGTFVDSGLNPAGTAGGALELVPTIAFNYSRGKYICGTKSNRMSRQTSHSVA